MIIVFIAIALLMLAAAIALDSAFGLGISDAVSQKLPKRDKIAAKYDDSYFVQMGSYFELQAKNQCGGFSSAYVLRCLGESAAGADIYSQMGRKLDNGYVLPQALTDTFADYGYKATLYRGDLQSLKTRLMQGIPIVILIGKGFSWQHYITVVGYDKSSVYVFDSNKSTDNSKGYNRVLGNAEFMDLWENGIPLFERVYFVIDASA